MKARAETRAKAKAEAKRLAGIEKKLRKLFMLLLHGNDCSDTIDETKFLHAMEKGKTPRKFILANPEMHGMLQGRDWMGEWEEHACGDNGKVTLDALLLFWVPRIAPYCGKSRKEMGMMRRADRKERERKKKAKRKITDSRADKYCALVGTNKGADRAREASTKVLRPSLSPNPSMESMSSSPMTKQRIVFRKTRDANNNNDEGAFSITTLELGGEELDKEDKVGAQARRRRTEVLHRATPAVFKTLS